jgi:hypothetical protein
MASYRLNNLSITPVKEGAREYTKGGFHLPYGNYGEISNSNYTFQFNLRGQIKFIHGNGIHWPHPYAHLKRTDGNDWVFHSVGPTPERHRPIDILGENYLPCLTYPSNSPWGDLNPYADMDIMAALGAWAQVYADLNGLQKTERAGKKVPPPSILDFISRIVANNENELHAQAKALHTVIGNRIHVLPPDTRHVEYEVIPLVVADGCRYRCRFCCVKSSRQFQTRTPRDIADQVRRLKTLYGPDLKNYCGIYIGDHDGLAAGDGLAEGIYRAVDHLGNGNGQAETSKRFLFGSVDSLLDSTDNLLASIESLPGTTYINIGFESLDPETLSQIGKPLDIHRIKEAFEKMLAINQAYDHIEITGNFLLGTELSAAHHDSVAEVLQTVPQKSSRKGAIYLSPLVQKPGSSHFARNHQNKGKLLQSFFRLKELSRLPAYMYLIQRL